MKEKKSACTKFVTRLVSMCIILMLVLAELVMPVMAAEGDAGGKEDAPKYDKHISSFDTYRWEEGIDLKNWMSKIPDCIQLSQLVIPGTHDSGMKNGGCAKTQEYTVCHDLYIPEQLEHGMRILDIRLWPKNGSLYVTHGPYYAYKSDGTWTSFDDVLNWCKDFLRAHPTETICLRAKYESDPLQPWRDESKETNQKIKEYWEKLKNDQGFAYAAGDVVPTLGEVRGKIVFFHEFDGEMCTKYEDHYNQPSSNKIECYKRVIDTSGYINYIDSMDHFIAEHLECYSAEDKNHWPEGEPEMKMVCTNVNTYHTDYDTEGPRKAFNKLYNDYHISSVDLFPTKHYGWIWMDFPQDEWTKKIISVNPTIPDDRQYMYWGFDASTGTLYMGNSETAEHGISLPLDTRYTGKYDTIPWSAYRTKIKKVVVDSEIHPSYTCGWFNGFTACTEFDLANLKTDRVYMMDDMFRRCSAVTELDITSFSNEQVVSARGMFAECESLQTIFADDSFDLKSAADNTGEYKETQTMFHYDNALEGSCGTRYSYGMSKESAHVDTPENPGLFSSNKTKGGPVYYGFSEDGTTMYLDSRKSDKTPNLNVMKEQDGKMVPSWYSSDAKEKVTSVFVQNKILPESMDYWFQYFSDATVFDLNLIDMSLCTSAEHTFEGCTSVEIIVLPPSSHSLSCSSMFEGCTNLKSIYAPEGCSMVDQKTSTRIFYGCTKLIGGNGTMYDHFYEPKEDYTMARIDGENGNKGYFTLKSDIYWGASNGTLYFSATRQPLTPSLLIDRKYDTNAGIITPWVDQRTHKTSAIKTVKVLEKIQPRHMSYWFAWCFGLEGTLNLSNIDTSLTLDMDCTFYNVGELEVIDLSGGSSASLISAKHIFSGWSGGQNVRTIYTRKDFSIEKFQGPLDEYGDDPGGYFVFQLKLVGGNGTKAFDIFKGLAWKGPQATYGRVDVPGQQGLFTLKEDKGQTLYYGIIGTRLYLSGRYSEKTPAAFTDKMFDEAPWTNMCQVKQIKTVEILEEISPVYTANWFKDLSTVENFILDKLDTSATVNMDDMFYGCGEWCKSLDITSFTSDSVKSAKQMFCNSQFETIWVNDFDLTGLSSADSWDMFNDCINIKGAKGTTYSVEDVDNERALYDGKDDKPGYFSNIKEKKYKISFVDDHMKPIQEIEVSHGETPEFTGVLPEKEPTARMEYVFDGWEPEIVPATEDAVYVGFWEPVDRVYAALFEDEAGELLDYQFFLYGDTPTTDIIPEKEKTDEAAYKFVSWKQVETTDKDREKIAGVRGDSIVVYKPVFEEITEKYTVTFVDDDETTVLYKEDFGYGSDPVYGGSTPTKSPDSEYSYKFEGWAPELAPVTAAATYKAKYTATPWGYAFTKGDGSVYTKGDSTGLLFEVSGPYLQLDDDNGMEVDGEYYWPVHIGGIDNVWFMMTPEDLNDLSAGEHTITVYYDHGQAPSAKFTVVDPQPETGLTIKKTDENGNPLEGAILSIENELGEEVCRWETSALESVRVALEPGMYSLNEVMAPAGYKKADRIEFKVSLTEEGTLKVEQIGSDPEGGIIGNEVEKLVMVDEFLPGDLPELDVTFVKKDAEGNRLKDAGLLVEGVSVDFTQDWISSDAEDKELSLKEGTYVMSEEDVPEGYLPAQSIMFRVKTNPDKPTELMLVLLSRDEDGDVTETPVDDNTIEMVDEAEPPLPEVAVEFSKTDKDGKLLEGASLKVVGLDIEYTDAWKSEADKDHELTLNPGTYIMSEVLAPEGYLTAQNITFRVTDELGVVIVDEEGTETPADKIVMVDEKKPVEAEVTIAKVTEDNILLGGADLKVEGKDVEFSETWTTSADENKKLVLLTGTYELTEIKAPEGYETAEAITFSVKDEDEIVVVEKAEKGADKETAVDYITMTDALKPVPTASVKISRTDGDGNMIAGAALYVKDTEDDYFRSWTSEEGKAMEIPLVPATYTITEKDTPEGYETPETVTFRVKEDLSLVLVEKNEKGEETEKKVDAIEMVGIAKPVPSPTVDVVFAKKDEYGTPVEGAELTVTGTDTDFKETWSTTGVVSQVLALPADTYVLKETKTPNNYVTADPITFRVKEDLSLVLVEGSAETPVDLITMIDAETPVPTANVSFSRTDENGNKVGGATLSVKGIDSPFEQEWTSEEGENKELPLLPGTYVITELTTPEGYETPDSVTFRVKDDLSLVLIVKDESGAESEVPVDIIDMCGTSKPVPAQYKIIEGANSTWTKGSGVTHKFASDAPYAKFVEVKIDGKTVGANNYTPSEGSTVVVFKAEYMETLAVGKHSIEIVSTDGSASANFKVSAKDTPPTGDNSRTALWIILMAVGAAVIATSLILIKRRKD